MKQRIFLFLVTLVCLIFTSAPSRAVHIGEPFDEVQLVKDLRVLSADDMKGRETGTEGSRKAREYILKRFKEVGLKSFEDDFIQRFSFRSKSGNLTGLNVVGYVRGSSMPEKYLVITAHYDHVGVNQGKIFNGADDNASGTAALFALAGYFAKYPPRHSLIFVAFDAEEKGLSGSKYFVSNPPVPRESIALNINMDMISHNYKNELYIAGTHHYPALKRYIDPLIERATLKLLYGHDRKELGNNDWTNSSDHAPFHKAGIPFIYFGVEDHKDYHKSTDTFESTNKEFFVKAVRTILDITKNVDSRFGTQK